jgi:hypothetical protein
MQTWRPLGLTQQEMAKLRATSEALSMREERTFGVFRTKGLVLGAWRRMEHWQRRTGP